MLDVLVTCHAHADEPSLFPQVRGFYLAKHLALAGLRAEFRQLPAPSVECRVVICSEFQCDPDAFAANLFAHLGEVRAERYFCLIDETLSERPEHFSRAYCDWFAGRGGVLCHLPSPRLAPHERWIGLGVDAEVIRPAPDRPRNRVLFDAPGLRASSEVEPAMIAALRHWLPEIRMAGSGPPNSPLRSAVDEWVDYGQTHTRYIRQALPGLLAFVPGASESLGLVIAEAQMAGACIVSAPGQIKDWMLCPEAAVSYEPDDVLSLAEALAEAATRDVVVIRDQAAAKFDFRAVAARTIEAIGLQVR